MYDLPWQTMDLEDVVSIDLGHSSSCHLRRCWYGMYLFAKLVDNDAYRIIPVRLREFADQVH